MGFDAFGRILRFLRILGNGTWICHKVLRKRLTQHRSPSCSFELMRFPTLDGQIDGRHCRGPASLCERIDGRTTTANWNRCHSCRRKSRYRSDWVATIFVISAGTRSAGRVPLSRHKGAGQTSPITALSRHHRALMVPLLMVQISPKHSFRIRSSGAQRPPCGICAPA